MGEKKTAKLHVPTPIRRRPKMPPIHEKANKPSQGRHTKG